MNGDVLLSFASFYLPAIVVGVVCRFLKPAWGWTPFWLGVSLTAVIFFLRKL